MKTLTYATVSQDIRVLTFTILWHLTGLFYGREVTEIVLWLSVVVILRCCNRRGGVESTNHVTGVNKN